MFCFCFLKRGAHAPVVPPSLATALHTCRVIPQNRTTFIAAVTLSIDPACAVKLRPQKVL